MCKNNTNTGLDYASRVEQTYASALEALREGVGLTTAEIISTGGGCYAICVDLDDAGMQVRTDLPNPHLLITVGSSLTDMRLPSMSWEVGVYDGDNGAGIYSYTLDVPDRDTDDGMMAQQVRIIWDGLRNWYAEIMRQYREEQRREQERAARLEELRGALQQFKQAAGHLLEAWNGVDGTVMGDSYPSHWHSFDEEICHINDMEVRG